jgi:hypothetical protein
VTQSYLLQYQILCNSVLHNKLVIPWLRMKSCTILNTAIDASTLYDIVNLIEMCRNERNVDRQLKILLVINAMLPITKKLHIPSVLTDDYIERALHEIEKALKSNY